MTGVEVAFATGSIGAWGEPAAFVVEPDRAVAYARATNDDHPRHLSGELAPPLFAVVPAHEVLAPAALAVIPADRLPFLVHGSQDLHLHAPIRPGGTLSVRVRPAGVHPRGSGTTVTLLVETRDGADLVNEQWVTLFVRGALAEGGAVGELAPVYPVDESVRAGDPQAEVSQRVDADQTFRYAEASGDHNPIHLDPDFARMAGLPGIIVHGLCTMAFVSRAVVGVACGGDATRLARLAVRFSKPVLPGQRITTRIWSAGEGGYAFETTSETGEVVIRNGWAETA